MAVAFNFQSVVESAVGSVGGTQFAVGDETVEAGDFLVGWATSNDTSSSFPFSVSGTGWTLAASAGGSGNWLGVWYRADAAFNETFPTFSDSGYNVTAQIADFTGVAASSPLDKTGSASNANPCTASAADTAASDLVVALSCWNGANANPTFSQAFTGSNGSSLTGTVIGGNSGAADEPYYIFSYAVNDSSLGSDANSVSASISEFENYVSSVIASFKAA